MLLDSPGILPNSRPDAVISFARVAQLSLIFLLTKHSLLSFPMHFFGVAAAAAADGGKFLATRINRTRNNAMVAGRMFYP